MLNGLGNNISVRSSSFPEREREKEREIEKRERDRQTDRPTNTNPNCPPPPPSTPLPPPPPPKKKKKKNDGVANTTKVLAGWVRGAQPYHPRHTERYGVLFSTLQKYSVLFYTSLMSRNVRKCTSRHVRSAKTQNSLRIPRSLIELFYSHQYVQHYPTIL